MMKQDSSAQRAFFIALVTCVVLIFAFVYFVTSFDMSRVDINLLFHASVLGLIALITMIVYQSIRISDTAEHLAEGMTKDLLLYSHELFSELYRSSPVPYLLVDVNGIVESANFAAVRLFHIEAGQLDHKNIFSFIEGGDETKVEMLPRLLERGVFVNEEEVIIVRLDGVKRWASLSLFSFTDSERKRKGLLTLIDITKQKEVDKAKTEFVSLASHQLRTPISAMKWNVELLHSTNPELFTPVQEAYILKIARGLTRMEALVQDFLNVSKLELGTFATEPSNLDLVLLVHDLLDEYGKKAETRSISIKESWEVQPFPIRSDAHLLSMVIGNLISNAIKYTPEYGTVLLSFTVVGSNIQIEVTDTGIGIPSDEQDHIFSKIFRASNAQQETTDGTGLGLYIVHEAVKVLYGTITFASEEGKGTTFTILLPAS